MAYNHTTSTIYCLQCPYITYLLPKPNIPPTYCLNATKSPIYCLKLQHLPTVYNPYTSPTYAYNPPTSLTYYLQLPHMSPTYCLQLPYTSPTYSLQPQKSPTYCVQLPNTSPTYSLQLPHTSLTYCLTHHLSIPNTHRIPTVYNSKLQPVSTDYNLKYPSPTYCLYPTTYHHPNV